MDNKNNSGYIDNLKELALNNNNFRQVLFTGEYMQLVLMSLLPNEEIGLEKHVGHEQFVYIVSGEVEVKINEKIQTIKAGSAVIVPSGAEHNFTNLSNSQTAKLYTIYSPAEHKDGTVHTTKP
jgi:mannose-6-phosphate isomerase-like protein (cupin superfamily)